MIEYKTEFIRKPKKSKKNEPANKLGNKEIVGKVIIISKTLMKNDGSGPLSVGNMAKKDKQLTPKMIMVDKMISLKFIDFGLYKSSIVCAQQKGFVQVWNSYSVCRNYC